MVLLALNTPFVDEEPGPDAEPKTALFVLRQLELSTSDAQLRGRIAQTKKYIEDEFSNRRNPGCRYRRNSRVRGKLFD
jgi:hypothetical protein